MTVTTDDRPGGTSPAGPPARPLRGGWDVLARYQGFIVPVVAVVLALLIGAVLIRLQGVNPTYAYLTLFKSALYTPEGILRTLQKATPLVFGGLAVVVGLRVGLFNIGAQGQLLWGSMGAVIVGVYWVGAPSFIVIPAAMLAGIFASAAWAGIAGLLKAWRGVHEVISTIMLNSIAAGILSYLVTEPLKQPGQPIPRSSTIEPAAELNDLGIVPVGFVVAVLIAVGVGWILRRTTTGFEVETVGKNPFAALYAGIKIPRLIVGAMCISGGLAGLGGAIETLGVVHRYEPTSSAGLGFDGITIALLARANPVATIPAALLVGVLRSGASTLQFDTGIQPEVVDVLLAIILLLVSLPVLAKALFGRRARAGVAVSNGWGS